VPGLWVDRCRVRVIKCKSNLKRKKEDEQWFEMI